MIRPQDILPRGEGSLLDADTVDGLHARDLIARVGELANREVRWEDIQGVPSTFPPEPHTHPGVEKHGSRHLEEDPIFPGGVTKGLLAANEQGPSETNPFLTRKGAGRVFRFRDSQSWTIVHNLGRHPVIITYTEGMQEVEGEVVHQSDNVAFVLFAVPMSGAAVVV